MEVIKSIVLIFSLCVAFTSQPTLSLSQRLGQPDDTLHQPANKKRITLLFATSGMVYAGSMIGLNQVWYSQYSRQSFRFFNDASEWKQMDKLGHLYSAFHIASTGSRIIQWARVNEKRSDKIAALTSWGAMASIEVLDGFSSGYGASASDLLANSIGSGLYFSQKLLWKEIRIHPKFSFHRTSLAQERPSALGETLPEEIIKDYNGQTEWLSFDVDKFMPFPKWLNVAVGYGAHNMIYANDSQNMAAGFQPYRQLYLSLDLDVTGIHSKSKIVKTLLYLVNTIKIPAPTLEFSQGKIKAHAFYF